MEQLQLMKFIYAFALLAILLTGLLTRSSLEPKVPYFNFFLIWATIFTLGLVFYMMKEELSRYLNPSNPIVTENDITLRKTYDNHFYLDAKINNIPIKFLIDTGASNILLSYNDAQKIGVDLNKLNFNIPHNTANGTIFTAEVTIQEIHIGNTIFKDMNAFIIPEDPSNQISILGMTFLDTFDYYIVDNDIMILKF